MYNPVSTYRLQFHKNFTLDDLERLITYFEKLGVGTVYASPVFEAVAGSTHGYDILDPNKINPEIGSMEDLRRIRTILREKKIGWLQDIVPNHMAFDVNNAWLMDVLEKGPYSVYRDFFDQAWTGELYHGRMIVPFLGEPLEKVIENEELIVSYSEPRLVLKYFDNAYPLNPRSYESILKIGEKHASDSVLQLLEQLEEMKRVEDAATFSEEWSEFMLQFSSLMKNEIVDSYVDSCIAAINCEPQLIKHITEEQSYRLVHWQHADKKITFRRFFTVNGLIGLNIQNEEVMKHHHQLIKQLVNESVFDGLRIDHIDGLFDPNVYLRKLRKLAGDHTYIVVEKILEPGEELRDDWPIQGSTGYDFLALVNNLFTFKPGGKKFTEFYQRLMNDSTPIHELVHQKKRNILNENMRGELDNLYHLFKDLNLADAGELENVDPLVLENAIGEFLVHCPVYRFYENEYPLKEEEAAAVQKIFSSILKNKPELSSGLDLIRKALLEKPLKGDDAYNRQALLFYQRSMQFTGPLMAKGVEDTLMYTYNRFIAHNEVGDSPEMFGLSAREFHEAMISRQQKWPLSLNATATHDTKRGEDVRARLNVLSEMEDEWFSSVESWQGLNETLKQDGAPDTNDEYFIYQALIGTYPMPGENDDDFAKRFQLYLEKASREAKRHTNWAMPNEEYENGIKSFACSLLDKTSDFWKSFQALHEKVADVGIVNSLSQTILKFTCPGVPDVYQGCELWDLSFVDPDNRRSVDYKKRQQWLFEIGDGMQENASAFISNLWQNKYNGKIKLWLVHTLLNLRKQNSKLFSHGEYIPIQVEGDYKDHLFAFARRYGQEAVIVAVPLHVSKIAAAQNVELQKIDWKHTHIVLPGNLSSEWIDIFSKKPIEISERIYVRDLFKNLPVAIMITKKTNERGAGVLMHITSLPSAFGIGDMGPEAKNFADFLHASKQKYWQILPINPTEQGQGHSPYSSICSRAGNTLLISPELLVNDGLLQWDDLTSYFLPQETRVNFVQAEINKSELFNKAWHAYKSAQESGDQQEFKQFCIRENEWLDDFAFYTILKKENQGKAWFQWDEKYKLRDEDALSKLRDEHADELQKVKWQQFVFHKQWLQLKTYCNDRNIHFFGDLPFYASYDSVDVWAHRNIFSLDEHGNAMGVAGVPPDMFSADGQLWGMPVFRWDVLKETGFDWWIKRLAKNEQLFDLLRLDHFRAFADYWEVPAGGSNAKTGEWKLGPGADFFFTVKNKLGDLDFVAEDLGEITNAVGELRDQFNLPGMKILQFAFDGDIPRSSYVPHNYTSNFIAYTGTHDNNTIVGWYRQDIDDYVRNKLCEYTGASLSEHNIHVVFGRMAYASVAKIVILPMQDVLGLDENARMNTPSSIKNNWGWRLMPGQLNGDAVNQLRHWTTMYNRE